MTTPFHALIVAAGSGARFTEGAGHDIPKQYCKLNNKSVLYHAVKSFSSHPDIKSLHVIINPQHEDLYNQAIQGLDIPPYIAGGKTRKISVSNGLKKLSNISNKEIILIHDGARPLTTHADIDNILNALKTNKAAAPALPLTDTACRTDQNNITDYIERENAYMLQTPQGFHAETLHKAHKLESDATDDTSLVRELGVDITLVSGSKRNIKITTTEDLKMAKSLIENDYSTRTGTGFDVHAFESEPSDRKLMLCGIEVEHDLALAGHSDADVGLHAITDAFLGAIGGGDIGDHFPPSDEQYKNADSAALLTKVLKNRWKMAFSIENIDITLICEKPKIGVYKDKMKNRVAQICEIDPNQVNIKATTTERLGFTGRGEGIAAQAAVTLKTWAN